MGIPGLLPFLQGAAEPDVHISAFRGHRCAIDGYAWLHRASNSCALEMARGQPTTVFVDYCMDLLRMIRHHGVDPIIVFDGGKLPAKRATEAGRRKSREEARRQATELLKYNRDAAQKAFAKAVDITPEHAHQLQRRMRAEGFTFYVAPYEADAQLALLARKGLVSVVVTEDSDLLTFGCPIVLYKMSKDGVGTLMRRARLAECLEPPARGMGQPAPLFAPWDLWDRTLFLDMCILAGCDYLGHLKGMGVATAHRLLRQHRNVEHAVRSHDMRTGDGADVDGYLAKFAQARESFLHQRVYDPELKRVVPLSGEGGGGDAPIPHCGADIAPEIAVALCEEGTLHPDTHEPFAAAVEVAAAAARPTPRAGGGAQQAGGAGSGFRAGAGPSLMGPPQMARAGGSGSSNYSGSGSGSGWGVAAQHAGWKQQPPQQPKLTEFIKHRSSTAVSKQFKAPKQRCDGGGATPTASVSDDRPIPTCEAASSLSAAAGGSSCSTDPPPDPPKPSTAAANGASSSSSSSSSSSLPRRSPPRGARCPGLSKSRLTPASAPSKTSSSRFFQMAQQAMPPVEADAGGSTAATTSEAPRVDAAADVGTDTPLPQRPSGTPGVPATVGGPASAASAAPTARFLRQLGGGAAHEAAHEAAGGGAAADGVGGPFARFAFTPSPVNGRPGRRGGSGSGGSGSAGSGGGGGGGKKATRSSGGAARKKKVPSPGDEENQSAQSPRKSPRLQPPPPPLPLSAFEFSGSSGTRSGSARGQRRASV